MWRERKSVGEFVLSTLFFLFCLVLSCGVIVWEIGMRREWGSAIYHSGRIEAEWDETKYVFGCLLATGKTC